MSESPERLSGAHLLTELSGEFVTIFRDALGKGPERCKTYWAGDDMLVVLLGGGFSVAEQTLFEAGRGAAVQDSRAALQETLASPMKESVERLTGRTVGAFMSASHQDPDLSAEIFLLNPNLIEELANGPEGTA